MPFQQRLIDHGRILLLPATGPADREDWTRLLPGLGDRSILLDLRRRNPLPTGDTALEIGRTLARNLPTGVRLALVAREGAQFGLVRMVDAMADPHGGAVRSLTDLRLALAWIRSPARPFVEKQLPRS